MLTQTKQEASGGFARRLATAADAQLPGAQLPLAVGFVLLILVALMSIWFAISGYRYNASVARTLQVRTEAYRLLTLIQDTETGQRGYLLTTNIDYLKPYENGRREGLVSLQHIRSLLAGHEVQLATLTRLEETIRQKLSELAETVALEKRGEHAAAIRRVNDNSGNGLMAQIRLEITQVEAEEVRAQAALGEAADFNNFLLSVATTFGVLLIIALAAYSIVLSRRSTQQLLAAQEELRAYNENLESLVADRVAELELANEEIQRFAYIVSHDLRAPLVNVMGFTSELEAVRAEVAALLRDAETAAPELVTADRKTMIATDLPEALSFIRTSTSKMDRLINAILKLSREGRRVLTPQKIEVRELVEAQGRSLSQQLSGGEAELVVHEDLPDLVSDRLAIEQIFGNLIENATKYLAPGRPGRIEVSGKVHGAYLRYDVKDNGRGIATKDFERIFELFRRSGEQDKPGEGIGLAYVRNLARRLGGNVSVQSELGVGSTFTVTLPSTFQTKARS